MPLSPNHAELAAQLPAQPVALACLLTGSRRLSEPVITQIKALGYMDAGIASLARRIGPMLDQSPEIHKLVYAGEPEEVIAWLRGLDQVPEGLSANTIYTFFAQPQVQEIIKTYPELRPILRQHPELIQLMLNDSTILQALTNHPPTIKVLHTLDDLDQALASGTPSQSPFIHNKAIYLTNLDEYEVRAILRSQGGWESSLQQGRGYEGQPKWTKKINGINHEVRVHPTPTRTNPNIRPGMGAYEGPVSRYGVELVPGGMRRLPANFEIGDPIPDNLKNLYAMDNMLRTLYGDQPNPMPKWGLHYLDPFGYAYLDEAGNLVGVASDHGHMYGKSHPFLGPQPWLLSPYHPAYWSQR